MYGLQKVNYHFVPRVPPYCKARHYYYYFIKSILVTVILIGLIKMQDSIDYILLGVHV